MVSKTGNPDSLGGANSEEIDVKNSHRKFGLICLVSLAGTMVTQLQGPFQKRTHPENDGEKRVEYSIGINWTSISLW